MPWNWAWSNYVDVISQFHVPITTLSGSREVWFEEMILNSVLFAVIGSLIQTFSVCWVAYLTQRFKNKVSSIIYLVVIFVMIIPSFNSQASLLKISRALGVYDTMFSYYFMKISFTNYFYLVFFAAFRALPKDYDESALVDGAGDLVIFFKIILPLVSGVFLTIFLLSFMGSWNDYMTPIVFMPSKYTIAYGVFYLVNGNVQGLSRVPLKLAICYLFSLPILILFIFFRDRIMNSVNIGGIKE
ncbi:MAG: carbohydrate ABC transporter permease [Clostridia bacterium]|nr:carbohydrate ABC transporter permease [Clostridia bacterium]